MAFIEWTEQLSVNIRVIDDQHKRLIEIINHLHEAMKAGRGREVLQPILDDLVAYTKYHFTTEEKFLRQYQYPDVGPHSEQHVGFTERIDEFRDKHRSNSLVVSMVVMEYLESWIINHIQKIDKQYAPFLNSRGLS